MSRRRNQMKNYQ
jgi:hypothetical protein